jgi:flagellar hook assembly protein FlgD
MQLTINEFSRQNLIKNFALESISQAMNFKIKNSLNDEITNFSKPVILKFPYDPVNLKNKGINEDNLKIFYLNELTEKLEVIPTTIDKINHFVIASVTHFSVYQLLAQKSFTGASNIIAYPNPCKMDESNLKIAGFDTNKNVEIKIYDITGKLIKKLNNFDLQIDNGLSVLQWNGRDQGGLRVATGVYIYVAKIDGAVKIEKVAIFQ